MKKKILLTLHIVCMLCLVVANDDDNRLGVSRSSRGGNLTEPHIGQNEFRNKNGLCFFSYCWNRRAHCGRAICCWCECKNEGTFFTQDKGCLSRTQIENTLGNEGK